MLNPTDLSALLTTLHAAGYRLRKLGPDWLEVAEGVPSVPVEAEPAQVDGPTLAEREFDEDKWAHVGGRPAFLREPKAREANPWVDTHPEASRS